MPADLPHREGVALEQVGRAGPVIQQAPDPCQADQADAELYTAGPVHTGQERVLPPPGAQLVRDPASISLVMGERPGSGEQREVLQPGEFPDLLDVADLLFRAVIDPEGMAVLNGPTARHRVEEPVRLYQVRPDDAQDFPFAAQQPLRAFQDGRPGLPADTVRRPRRQDGGELTVARQLRLRRELSRLHLTREPHCPQHLVTRAPRHLGGRHRGDPAEVPPEPRARGHTRSGFPLDRLSPTATVALVTATSASNGIG